MGFLDFFKNLFGKKEPPLSSPSEQPSGQVTSGDGQFATPQNPADTQAPNTPPSSQAGQPENPTS